MNSLVYLIKGQVTILNLFLLLLAIAFYLNKYHKRKAAKTLLILTVVLFLLSATDYLPRYLITQLENKYLPLDVPKLGIINETYYIHVLGSGNNLDDRLPPNTQLGLVAIGRLAEAIRIHRQINNSKIICSANSVIGLETQASVTKRAAAVLGIDTANLLRLDTPSTTKEEAEALHTLYGNKIKLIIVTDAMHMPRAIKYFLKEGFTVIAAPTNYRAPKGPASIGLKFWPNINNINLTDLVLHEYLGTLKSAF